MFLLAIPLLIEITRLRPALLVPTYGATAVNQAIETPPLIFDQTNNVL